MSEFFSQNGSILIKPSLSVTECNGKDELTIDIYHVDTGYLYGIRAKLPPRCYQYQPHPADTPLQTDIEAKHKARGAFLAWCDQNNLKKRGICFSSSFDQLELFPV